jgi:hypothetical protein
MLEQTITKIDGILFDHTFIGVYFLTQLLLPENWSVVVSSRFAYQQHIIMLIGNHFSQHTILYFFITKIQAIEKRMTGQF